jgi:hypothetical protein
MEETKMRKTIISYLKRILRIDESHKMSEEERTINKLERYIRQRNRHIVAASLLLVVMVSASIYILSLEYKLNKMMAPNQIKKMATFKYPEHELPILFYRFYVSAGAKAKFIVDELYFGTLTGLVIFMLINEFAGFTRNKHKLTLSMWQTIKQLENEVKELKAHTPANDQQVDRIDRADKSV